MASKRREINKQTAAIEEAAKAQADIHTAFSAFTAVLHRVEAGQAKLDAKLDALLAQQTPAEPKAPKGK